MPVYHSELDLWEGIQDIEIFYLGKKCKHMRISEFFQNRIPRITSMNVLKIQP